jgi:hypothetical protein
VEASFNTRYTRIWYKITGDGTTKKQLKLKKKRKIRSYHTKNLFCSAKYLHRYDLQHREPAKKSKTHLKYVPRCPKLAGSNNLATALKDQ